MFSNSHLALRNLSISRGDRKYESGGRNRVDESVKMKYLRSKKRNYSHRSASSDPQGYIHCKYIGRKFLLERAKVISTLRQVEIVSSHSTYYPFKRSFIFQLKDIPLLNVHL